MCGRFTLRTPTSDWTQIFLPAWEGVPPRVEPPRFNIAPTQEIPAVYQERSGEPRSLVWMRWGLVPSWAQEQSIGYSMINARAESVDEKPSFRKAFQSRRALVIADGYYEWKKIGNEKQPYLIERVDQAPFAFAGLWEINRKATSAPQGLTTCTIITTTANDFTNRVHDRMPVILREQDFDGWLDPNFRDTTTLKALLRPLPNDELRLTPVDRRVGNVRNTDPSCATAIGPPEYWQPVSSS